MLLQLEIKQRYNTADKMFMLSKYAPVGILIYNSASIMGIQLEIIIKQYRRKLGEKDFSNIKKSIAMTL